MKQLYTKAPGYRSPGLLTVLLVAFLASAACGPQPPSPEPAVPQPAITLTIPPASIEPSSATIQPSPPVDAALEGLLAASPQASAPPSQDAQSLSRGIPNEPLPPGAKVETVLEGLNEPVAMAFDPSGRIFYIERPGAVRVAAGGVVRPEPVIVLPTDTCSERGMVGLALDPNFASNGYIYIHYT